MVPDVDSIVVSSLFSVYNPAQEQEVKRLITKNHQIPVVMGHELTGEEWACVEDDVARVCDEAFAEWLEDRGEYQRDCRMDARAMGSYVHAQVQA